MDEHPQDRQRLQRYCICSLLLFFFSCVMIIVGVLNVAVGADSASKRNEPDWLYQINPEGEKQGQIQMNAGVGVLVTGVVVLILSSTWACYVGRKLSGSRDPNLAIIGPTTSNANALNFASTLEMQPSIVHGPGRLPTYEYSYQQQAGSIQQVQTGTNQYTPAPPAIILYTPEQTAVSRFTVARFAINQYTPAQLALNQLPPAQTAINRYASDPADQPPPSYNEVMRGSSFI